MSSSRARLVLYAPNVHTGGGAVLLQALMDAWPRALTLHAWLDFRAQPQLRLPSDVQVEWVKPTVSSRLRAEYTLARAVEPTDRVFCFHGLPPLLLTHSLLVIFQQNRNLLGSVPLHNFSWRTRQRLRFEQAVARLLRHRCSSYWVQTPSMARALKNWYGEQPVDIRVLPFSPVSSAGANADSTKWDFVYPADGEAHKNHRRLIDAWIIMARQGINPSLALTLSDRDAKLLLWIDQQIARHGLNIVNLGQLPHDELLRLYGRTQALVFPSISESFGLPLIEASQAGLPILASELDFVRDVCEPNQTFDPGSAVSIARAVRRFLGQPEPPVQPVDAAAFLKTLMADAA